MSFSDLRLLVVDDDPFTRSLIERVLRLVGVRDIRGLPSAQDALEVIDLDPPDIILCDLEMPGTDGAECLRHLADHKFGGAVAIISGKDHSILEAAQELGRSHRLQVLGSLQKPATKEALSRLLGKYLPEAKADSLGAESEIAADELKDALNQHVISVNFQPQISSSTKELVAVEALARWHHPDKGAISPGIFAALAESNGLIDDLTKAVVNLSLQQARAWKDVGLDIEVSINLSMGNLSWLELPETIEQAVNDLQLDPRKIVLELTESQVMGVHARALEVMTRLRLKGFHLSIDDFGTGHSSLAQLKRFPFTELKIDRAFVNGSHANETARSILESSVSLAQKLGLRTVAEGVEQQDDLNLVTNLGVDRIQGYFVGRPMLGKDLAAWNVGRGGIGAQV